MNIKKELIFISVFISIFAVLLFILFNGCSQNKTLTVDIASAAYECGIEDDSFKMSYIDCNDNFVSRNISSLSDINGEIALELQKNTITPLLIEFSSRDEEGNHQKIGFLYPITTEFSKAGAFCANIYFKLLLNSTESSEKIRKFCSYFNWNRFYEMVCDYDDPFVLNEEVMCHDIASGNFSSYSFREK